MEDHERSLFDKLYNFTLTHRHCSAAVCAEDHEHGEDIVEEVCHGEDHVVVEDGVSVSHDVSAALSVDEPTNQTSTDSEHTGGELVTDVEDAIVGDVEVITVHLAETAAPEEGLETVEDDGEEDEPSHELNATSDEIRTLTKRINHLDICS